MNMNYKYLICILLQIYSGLLLCPFQHIQGKEMAAEPEKNNQKIFQEMSLK